MTIDDLMRLFRRKHRLDFICGAIWGGVIVAGLFWGARLL